MLMCVGVRVCVRERYGGCYQVAQMEKKKKKKNELGGITR